MEFVYHGGEPGERPVEEGSSYVSKPAVSCCNRLYPPSEAKKLPVDQILNIKNEFYIATVTVARAMRLLMQMHLMIGFLIIVYLILNIQAL